MSELQKSIQKSKLPPRIPKGTAKKLAPFGGSRKKDYTPISWKEYFTKQMDVETSGGTFRVYLSEEPTHPERPRIVALHGGGYSGLSWALFTKEITQLVQCQVIAIDIRGHGETKVKNPEDLSAETLVNDIEEVLLNMYEELPPLVFIGHSMGGALAVRVAHSEKLAHHVLGVAVIDVVEGTAMECLSSMQSFLRCRPSHFRSIEHAIEWCVRSGQVRNVESARVSMPGQIVNCETNLLATNEVDTYVPESSSSVSKRDPLPALRDAITEEDDAQTDEQATATSSDKDFKSPPLENKLKYKWRIDLSATEKHWSGWFRGLSELFLAVRAPKILMLASIDGLDTNLTLGQMQGKFEFRVLSRCGHCVHEDTPGSVCSVLATFMLRHRITASVPGNEHLMQHNATLY